MAMKLTEAFVEITAKMGKLKSQLDRAVRFSKRKALAIGNSIRKTIQRSLTGLLKFAIRWAKRMALVFAAMSALVIKFASDAEQVESRARFVFGGMTKSIKQFADKLADDVGRSKTELLSMVAVFQTFFVGLGFVRDEANKLSKQMTELTLDFASFNDISDAEAMQRFISGLSGSGEVLDRFGINIKQAALDAELLAKGLPTVSKGATEQSKAVARLSLIYRAMASQNAIGNAIDTSEEFANKLKAFRGEMKEVAITVGNVMLGSARGSLSKLVERLKELRQWLIKNSEALKGAFTQAMKSTANVVKDFTDRIKELLQNAFDISKIEDLEITLVSAVIRIEIAVRKAGIQIEQIIRRVQLAINKLVFNLGAAMAGMGLPVPKFIDKELVKRIVFLQEELDLLEAMLLARDLRPELRIKKAIAAIESRRGQPSQAPTIPDLPQTVQAGDISRKIAKALVSSIQTALGQFKTGQATQELTVLKDIDSEAKKMRREIEKLNRALAPAGFAFT